MKFEDIFRKEIENAYKYELPRRLSKYLSYRELRLQGFYPEHGNTKVIIEQLRIGDRPKIRKFNYDIIDNKMVSNSKEAIKIYKKYWIGNKGAYRKEQIGNFVIFDEYETSYLLEIFGEKVELSEEYYVYKLFRDAGYTVKSGYKYGGLFRIYDIGYKREKDQHSIFIYNHRYVINGMCLQRMIRIVESVNKTLLLPYRKANNIRPDFIMRKNNEYYNVYVYNENSRIDPSKILERCLIDNRLPLIAILDRENDVLKISAKVFKIKDKYFIGLFRLRV